jgi:DtxR family transcriptional regulator, Mn-dependent transcriptional regulator
MAARKPNPNTESVDNYLKAILALGGPEEQRVTSTALSDRLGVAPASVTNMLQKLATSPTPLVEYERHRGVRLSAAGKRRAIEVVRHHRLIETFLYKVLDYPIEEVHEEAERLEHFISERFEERIAAKLGHPKIDPHGHCIPTLDGEMPKQDSIPLTEIREEGLYSVESICDDDATLLKSLRTRGIVPGVRIRVRNRNPKDGYGVTIGGSPKVLHLSRDAADAIRIHSPI